MPNCKRFCFLIFPNLFFYCFNVLNDSIEVTSDLSRAVENTVGVTLDRQDVILSFS